MSDDFTIEPAEDGDDPLDLGWFGGEDPTPDGAWVDDLVDSWVEPGDPDLGVDDDEVTPVSDDEQETAATVPAVSPVDDAVRLDLPEDAVAESDDVEGGPDPDAVQSFPAGELGLSSVLEAMGVAGNLGAIEALEGLDLDVAAGRTLSAALDLAGVDARVEHTDVGDLRERLDAGTEIVFGGSSGGTHVLVAIDPVTGEAVVVALAGGLRLFVPLDDLVDAWDEVSNELLVVSGDPADVQLGGSDVCILPLSIGDLTNGGI